MKYDVILWDLDNTLTDFLAAEHEAIKSCFQIFHLGICTDEMIQRYSAINIKYWEMLERGEIEKADLLVARFRDFFESEGIDTSMVQEFNDEYQIRLGDTICYNDDSYELVQSLTGRVEQYMVTNGTVIAQKRKLSRSGFDQLVDGIFISDLIGFDKPRAEFFDYVFSEIGEDKRERTIIVGDSLTSDMQGGINASIATCWYNPHGFSNTKGLPVDYEIQNLRQILDYV